MASRSLGAACVVLAVTLIGCMADRQETSAAALQTTPQPRAHNLKRPDVNWRPIGFGDKRRRETKRYAERHYGISTWRLEDPQVIVEHMAETESADVVFSIFAPDQPDAESGELPGLCAHYFVGDGGRIDQYARLGVICRHTAGLNYTAIGIEHAGSVAPDVLGNSAQLRSSLELTHWLLCRFQIKIGNVIGHNESLSSPFYLEHVDSFKGETHDDWPTQYMDRYRHKLRRMPECPARG